MLLIHTSQENYLYCPGPGPVSFEWNLTAPCGLTLQKLKALAEPCAQQRREREGIKHGAGRPLWSSFPSFSLFQKTSCGERCGPDSLPYYTHLPLSGTRGWPGVALASFLSVEKDKKFELAQFWQFMLNISLKTHTSICGLWRLSPAFIYFQP